MNDWTIPPKDSLEFKILYLYCVEQKTPKEISAELCQPKGVVRRVIGGLPPVTRPETVALTANMDDKIKQKF
jgi:hypothetical protein